MMEDPGYSTPEQKRRLQNSARYEKEVQARASEDLDTLKAGAIPFGAKADPVNFKVGWTTADVRQGLEHPKTLSPESQRVYEGVVAGPASNRLAAFIGNTLEDLDRLEASAKKLNEPREIAAKVEAERQGTDMFDVEREWESKAAEQARRLDEERGMRGQPRLF